jgi:hypothetical protein
MVSPHLCLHRGAIEVSRQQLDAFEAPPASGRWFPLKHSAVLQNVGDTLEASGYQIAREQIAVGRDGHRMFGTLDLTTPLVSGVHLCCGIRNSTDKSFPLGFCAGSRVFVCDNLSFRSELLVKRKHTRYGEVRFANAIAGAIQSLRSFQDVEANRIRRLQQTAVSQETASHYVLQALEKGIVSAPVIPRIWKEILTPSFDYGGEGLTLWSVLQSFTTILGERAKRSPSEYAGQTIRLNQLISPTGPFGLATTGDATDSPLANAV